MRKCFCRYHALEDVGELGALRSHLAGRLVVFALLARVVGLHELAHVLLEHVVVRRAGHILPQTRGQPTVIGDDVIFFWGGGGVTLPGGAAAAWPRSGAPEARRERAGP